MDADPKHGLRRGTARADVAPLVAAPTGPTAGELPETCANCGNPIAGDYCARCGQETRLRLPSAPQFVREAAGRYIAFDGRLWRTLGALAFRPGFLTREYFAGRRRRYVRPARLFLVLSVALFALLRFEADAPLVVSSDGVANADAGDITVGRGGRGVHLDSELRVSLERVDAPWLAPVRVRLDEFNHLSKAERIEQIYAGILRYGPYAMAALLPAFAMLVQIAYLGRSRRHPGRPDRYAGHLVFAAHNHAFLFLCAGLAATIPLGAVRTVLAAWALTYMVASMRVVYGGSWLGTLVRGGLLAATYLVLFAFATGGLLVAAILLR